jgi:hypothetical protein
MAEPAPTLTEKQLRFACEYAADPNATQAYRRAFGSCSYNMARTEGPRLLANPAVKAEINAARLDYQYRVRVNATKVLRWTARLRCRVNLVSLAASRSAGPSAVGRSRGTSPA